MSHHLVVVESPAKSKTIKKYLGKDFSVVASYGHVRDLLPKKGSVLPEDNFAMKYTVIEKNARHIQAIADELKKADTLYLATDPDREGEAISWHIYELLRERKALKNKKVYRVVFYEITKTAITEAMNHPREISMDLVNAQQARRALDYLVGFNLSPLLWKKVRRGLSAGRVQSPALRMIVEREEEIEKFISQEYWTIKADNRFDNTPFQARLVEYGGEKIEQFSVTNAEQAHNIEAALLKQAAGKLTVSNVEKKQRKRNPAMPFITSTLQQDAARKLGFSARKTMSVAQQLYEGIDIGGETVGLITYMRTDSVNLAQDAINELRDFIKDQYGADYLPKEARTYKTKSKNAQEAHEAIRPTSALRMPESLKGHLRDEQFKLYELIWKRTVACQMIHALVDTVAVDLVCGGSSKKQVSSRFRANGSTVAHPGFMLVYQESVEENQNAAATSDDNEQAKLPSLKVNDEVELLKIVSEQHFTEPPPRYSEATLIKALEEHGIGRPSTYASIIENLQKREYALLDKKRFVPTDVGRIVNGFLTKYFSAYVDYDFTAKLEDDLDAIARGEKVWIPLLENFWQPFKNQVTTIDETIQRSDVTTEQLKDPCPKCGKPLSIRLGRRGRFIGCTGYPECDYTANVDQDTTTAAPEIEIVADRKCPECSSDLLIKTGRYGRFIGCSNYPKCKHMEPLQKPADTNIQCPECHQGTFLQRKSRYGKLFYSCSRYPECQYAVWNEPIDEPCPQCHWPILTIKETKRKGKQKVCPRKTCGYEASFE